MNEDEVLAAAMRIMFDRGLHAVTQESTAAYLGVQVRTVVALQPRFPAFIAEVFRRSVAAELAEVKRATLAHPAARDQLRALVVLLAEPVHAEVSAAWSEAFAIGRLNPALAAVARSEQASWHRFLTSMVQRGTRSGDWSTDHPEVVAAHLLAVVDSINAYALVDYDTGVPRRRMLESVVEFELGLRFSPVEGLLERGVPAV